VLVAILFFFLSALPPVMLRREALRPVGAADPLLPTCRSLPLPLMSELLLPLVLMLVLVLLLPKTDDDPPASLLPSLFEFEFEFEVGAVERVRRRSLCMVDARPEYAMPARVYVDCYQAERVGLYSLCPLLLAGDRCLCTRRGRVKESHGLIRKRARETCAEARNNAISLLQQ